MNPNRGPSRQRMVRIPAEWDAALERMAAERATNVSALIREAVRLVYFLPSDDTQLHNHVPDSDTGSAGL